MALLRVVGDVIILEWKEGVIFTCILGSLIPVRFMGKVKIVIFFSEAKKAEDWSREIA
jgi:hypothetical protein